MEDTRPIRLDGAVGGMTEEALLRGLREQDAQASSELCRRFTPKLHRFAAARLGWDTALAEDIAIQSLTDAVRKSRGLALQPGASLAPARGERCPRGGRGGCPGLATR